MRVRGECWRTDRAVLEGATGGHQVAVRRRLQTYMWGNGNMAGILDSTRLGGQIVKHEPW